MNRRSHWRFFLLRWHRRIGVVLGFYLFWMAGTGISLNHAGDLGLDHHELESPFWLSRYDVAPPFHFMVGAQDFRLSGQGLSRGDVTLGDCARLLGVANLNESQVVVCNHRVVLLSPQGEVIEQSDASHGLPGPFSAMAVQDRHIYLKQDQSDVIQELDTLDFSLHAIDSVTLPATAWIPPVAAPSGLTAERMLQDLHSGRMLGAYGPWLVDLLGLAVMVLAITGWALAKKRHHKM